MKRFSVRFWVLVLRELMWVPLACIVIPLFFQRELKTPLALAYISISAAAALVLLGMSCMSKVREDKLALRGILGSLGVLVTLIATVIVFSPR